MWKILHIEKEFLYLYNLSFLKKERVYFNTFSISITKNVIAMQLRFLKSILKIISPFVH